MPHNYFMNKIYSATTLKLLKTAKALLSIMYIVFLQVCKNLKCGGLIGL